MSEEHDERLGDLYRLSSREEPPARLDRAVMAQASQSLRRRTLSPFGNHWVAAGALAGICIVSVLLVVLMPEQAGMLDRPQTAGETEAPLAERKAQRQAAESMTDEGDGAVLQAPSPAEQEAEPRFDFYSVMPDSPPEVQTGERIWPAMPMPRQEARPATWFLSIGGYRTLAEAGKMQDKLEFMRLRVRVQQVASGDAQSYYRLSVGPYTDLDELDRVQALLHKRGIDSTRVRMQ